MLYSSNCYYLNGSGGACVKGSLAPQDILSTIASSFVGKNYKTTVSSNCCIWHLYIATQLQDWGMTSNCNTAGPFSSAPALGGTGCNDANNQQSQQLTLCFYAAGILFRIFHTCPYKQKFRIFLYIYIYIYIYIL